MENTLYIVMPTYNESQNIKSVIKEWYPMLSYGDENSKIVVADGGSTDNTLDILFSLQSEYPKLEIISKPGTDHGTKVILLYKYALSQDADWIFQTDTDGQTLPSEFPEFWELREHHEIIMGNRIKRGDGFSRKVVEYILRIYLKLFFGVMVPDSNAPFRLMKHSVLEKYMGLMPDVFNLPNAVLAACFSRYQDNVIYKEITFRPRQGGKNFMNLKRIFHIGMESIHNFSMIKQNMKEYEQTL